MSARWSRWMVERGGLLALACLALYAYVASPNLSTGDNAEFAGLGAMGGAAHPTGYPLYVLWLRAWSWLPGETPAHTAALATALLGAGSVLVLHAACRAWGATASAASFTVALVASTPLVVRLSSEAEVFALNGVVAGAVLLLAAPDGPLRGRARGVALGLVAGLGLANHLTCALLAPIGIYGVVCAVRETPRGKPAVVAFAVGGLVLGLLPYAYLVVVPETRVSWGKVEGLGGLVHHVLRMDYGGPAQLGAKDLGGTPGANLAAFWRTLAWGLWWGPFFVGFAMLAARVLVPGPRRAAWAWLGVSWLLVGPILVARFNLPPTYTTAFITQRFHMLPLIVFAIPVASGLAWVGPRIAARVRSPLVRSPVALALLPLLLMVGLQARALPELANERSRATERAIENMLASLPPGAVVIGTPDEYHFGMGYLQGALGQRPDVVAITWQLVGLPYIRERIHRQLGLLVEELPPGSPQKLSVVVAEKILATGRPLFIDQFQGNIATSFPIYPYGLVYRVLPRGTAVPPIQEVFAINKRVFERYRLDYRVPEARFVVPAQPHVQYAATWTALARALDAAGLRAEAEEARALAFALAPEQ